MITDKNSILELLKEYGDSHSNIDTPLPTLQRNLKFAMSHGSKENNIERYNLTKDLPLNYKILISEPIENIRKRHSDHLRGIEKKEIIDFLLKFGYKENYLRRKKYDSIVKLRNDPKLYEKYGKRELGNIICNNYGISKSTIRNWNFQKTRDFFRKDLYKNYNSICRKKNDIQDYLRGLTSSLFCDIIKE